MKVHMFDLPYWADLTRPLEDLAALDARIALLDAERRPSDMTRAVRDELAMCIFAAAAYHRGERLSLGPVRRASRRRGSR